MLWHCAVCTLDRVVSENISCVTYDTVPYVQLLRHSAVSEWWAGAVCLCRGSYTGNFAFDVPETTGRKSDGSWRQLPHSWLTSKHYLLFIVIICSGNNDSDSSTATTHGWRRGIVVSGVRQWTKLTHVGPGYNWDGWPSLGGYTISGCNKPTRSTQPCIPPGSLNRVPALAGVKVGMSPLPGSR